MPVRVLRQSESALTLKSFFGIFSGTQQMPMGKLINLVPLRGNQVSEPARLRGRVLWVRMYLERYNIYQPIER